MAGTIGAQPGSRGAPLEREAAAVLFVDVVPHDDIGKYGRKPPGA